MYGNHPNIPRKAISFTIEAKRFERVEERARAMGYRVPDYARMLFEAGYAARVDQERGVIEPTDRDLDRQVRQVFLLADCEPEFIADALNVPKERVRKIISGWKETLNGGSGKTSCSQREPEGKQQRETVGVSSAGGEKPAPPAPDTRRKRRAWTDEERQQLKELWAKGLPTKEIAAILNRDERALSTFIAGHRGLCPKRRNA